MPIMSSSLLQCSTLLQDFSTSSFLSSPLASSCRSFSQILSSCPLNNLSFSLVLSPLLSSSPQSTLTLLSFFPSNLSFHLSSPLCVLSLTSPTFSLPHLLLPLPLHPFTLSLRLTSVLSSFIASSCHSISPFSPPSPSLFSSYFCSPLLLLHFLISSFYPPPLLICLLFLYTFLSLVLLSPFFFSLHLLPCPLSHLFSSSPFVFLSSSLLSSFFHLSSCFVSPLPFPPLSLLLYILPPSSALLLQLYVFSPSFTSPIPFLSLFSPLVLSPFLCSPLQLMLLVLLSVFSFHFLFPVPFSHLLSCICFLASSFQSTSPLLLALSSLLALFSLYSSFHLYLLSILLCSRLPHITLAGTSQNFLLQSSSFIFPYSSFLLLLLSHPLSSYLFSSLREYEAGKKVKSRKQTNR